MTWHMCAEYLPGGNGVMDSALACWAGGPGSIPTIGIVELQYPAQLRGLNLAVPVCQLAAPYFEPTPHFLSSLPFKYHSGLRLLNKCNTVLRTSQSMALLSELVEVKKYHQQFRKGREWQKCECRHWILSKIKIKTWNFTLGHKHVVMKSRTMLSWNVFSRKELQLPRALRGHNSVWRG